MARIRTLLTVDKVLTQTEAAREAGMSERQQVTAVRIANVPAEEFEKAVESASPPACTPGLLAFSLPRSDAIHPPGYVGCSMWNYLPIADFAASAARLPTLILSMSSSLKRLNAPTKSIIVMVVMETIGATNIAIATTGGIRTMGPQK